MEQNYGKAALDEHLSKTTQYCTPITRILKTGKIQSLDRIKAHIPISFRSQLVVQKVGR